METTATLRVDYTQPGRFQWGNPSENEAPRWVISLEEGPQGRRLLRPSVYERTREAALQAVRRLDPQLRDAMLKNARWADPSGKIAPHVVEEDEIFPTRLELCVVYIPCLTNARPIHSVKSNADQFLG